MSLVYCATVFNGDGPESGSPQFHIYIYIYIYLYISSKGNNISKSLCPSGFLMYVSVCLFVSLLVRMILCHLSARQNVLVNLEL